MTIALVTITYNGMSVWEDFERCVMAQDADWHLYVIDNNSTDGTRERLAAIRDPRVTIVSNDTNRGVAGGNNQGIELALEAGATRIVLINNDVVFDHDLLNRLEAEMAASGADAISPLIPYYDRPDLVWYGGGRFIRHKGLRNTHDHDGQPVERIATEPFRTDYAPTCCLMFDASVFRRIGMMDERYFVYWDDTDFLWRMKLAGMTLILDPRVRLLHKVSSSTGGKLSDFSIRYSFRNQIYYARKFHGPFWSIYTAMMEMLAGVLRIVRDGDSLRHLVLRARALREGFAMPRDRAAPQLRK